MSTDLSLVFIYVFDSPKKTEFVTIYSFIFIVLSSAKIFGIKFCLFEQN